LSLKNIPKESDLFIEILAEYWQGNQTQTKEYFKELGWQGTVAKDVAMRLSDRVKNHLKSLSTAILSYENTNNQDNKRRLVFAYQNIPSFVFTGLSNSDLEFYLSPLKSVHPHKRPVQTDGFTSYVVSSRGEWPRGLPRQVAL